MAPSFAQLVPLSTRAFGLSVGLHAPSAGLGDRADGIVTEPPPPCSTLPAKRLEGWRGYYFKVLASMSSFWGRHYHRMLYLDCGMQVTTLTWS